MPSTPIHTISTTLTTGITLASTSTYASPLTITDTGAITAASAAITTTVTAEIANNGTLSGGSFGITAADMLGLGATILNDGVIEATGGAGAAGILLNNGGVIFNQAGGTIAGDTGVAAANGTATITNAGTITGTGGMAVSFGDATSLDQLIIDPGAVFDGLVNDAIGDGTIHLASDAISGTLSNLASFTGFDEIIINPGADWHLSGADSLGLVGTITDFGTLTAEGPFTNDGLIIADPSTLIFDSAVTGTGTIEIGAGSDVIFYGSVAATETIEFLGTTGTLTLYDQPQFDAQVIGTGNTITCFYPGTSLATPTGGIAVEAITAGTILLTGTGPKPVRWLGRSTISTRFADPLRALPIRIKTGALGLNTPYKDLLVSPDHALFLGNILVQAGALVNHSTIIRETNIPEIFTYYHVELASHELILAEGAWTESFVDNASRMNFDNWAEYQALGIAAPIPELPYPRAKSRRQLPQSLRQTLAA